MVEFKINFFVRLLSSIYVYLWIPIRLNYLRLKIKMRTALNILYETFVMSVFVVTIFPLSIVYMILRLLTYFIEWWIELLTECVSGITGICKDDPYISIIPPDLSSDDEEVQDCEEEINACDEEETRTEE